jgi:hypothetical protein
VVEVSAHDAYDQDDLEDAIDHESQCVREDADDDAYEDPEQWVRDSASAAAQGEIAEAVLGWNLARTPEARRHAAQLVDQAVARVEQDVGRALDRAREGPAPATTPSPVRTPSTEEEVALLESDMSVPSYLRAMADAWGTTLTQDDHGRWRTCNHPDDKEGPNTTFLQKQVDYLREKLAETRSENEDTQKEVKEVRRTVRDAIRQVKDADQQNDKLREEVFQLNDALTRAGHQWEGPTDDCASDVHNDKICNPEHEYRQEVEKRTLQGQEPPSWDDFWSNRPYFSKGRTTEETERGPGGAFRFAGTKECERLHPGRADHAQVPWFQCVADQCGYHFKEKFDRDHWPVRTTDEDGLPEPRTWVFDHGHGYHELLWAYERAEGGRLSVRPRRAWPEKCQGMWLTSQCPDRACVFHLVDKAHAQHAHQQAMERQLQRRRARNEARTARTAREKAMEEDEQAEGSKVSRQDDTHEGDASQDQDDLGNDSGASSGPSQL